MAAINQVKKALQKDPQQVGNYCFQFTDQVYDSIHRKASFHSQATRLNQNSVLSYKNIDRQNQCHCGCKKGNGESFSFFTDQQKLHFLGPGIILYFYYLKSLFLVLGIAAIIYAIYPLVLNLIGSAYPISQTDCSSSYIFVQWLCEYKTIAAIQNRDGNDMTLSIQLFSGIFISLLWILSLRIIRYYGRLKNQQVDTKLDSSSDYCIEINDLPYGQYHQYELMEVIKQLYDSSQTKKRLKDELKIKSVQIIYNISDFRKLLAKLNEKIIQIADYFDTEDDLQVEGKTKYFIKLPIQKNAQTSENPNQSAYINAKCQIIELYEKLKDFRTKFVSDQNFRKNMATCTCLVQFVVSEQQTQFLNEFGRFRYSVFRQIKQKIINWFVQSQAPIIFKDKYLVITRAPEPSDINWKNCEKQFHYWRIGAVWLITFCVIGISFGMLMLISYLRKNIPALSQFSILISISLQIFNRLIWKTLVKIVNLQENNTQTDAIISIMGKASFAQAVNVLVLPIIMNVYIKDNLDGPNGLTGIIVDFQFTVFMMAIAMNLVDPPYRLKQLILCLRPLRNKMIFHLSKIIGKQYDSSEIKDVYSYYEQPEFPIAGAYVYMLTTISQAFFYCFLQPTLLFVITANMGLFLLIQKYMLFKRCKIPPLTDLIVFETCVGLSMRIPLFFGVGTLYFVVVQEHLNWVHILPCCLIIFISLLGMYNPKQIFTKCMWFFIDDDDEPQYLKKQKLQAKKKLQVTQIQPNPSDISANGLILQSNGSQVKVIGRPRSPNTPVPGANFNQEDAVKSNNTSSINIQGSKKDDQISVQEQPIERRECYYINSNINHLLNFQKDFMELPGVSTNLSKKFCQRFKCNYVQPQQINKCTAFMMINNQEQEKKQDLKKLEKLKKQKLKNAKLKRANRFSRAYNL